MKIGLILALCLLSSVVYAKNIEEDPTYNQEKYAQDGKAAAKLFMAEYLQLDKPKYQRVYSTYKRGLEILPFSGKLSRNPELEQDLNAMNSDQKFIYKQTKRRGGNLYKRYKY